MSLTKVVLAIDPGQSGGLAMETKFGGRVAWKMPENDATLLGLISEISANYEERVAVMERVSGFAGEKQPGSAMFSFGEGYGFIRGVLMALKWRLELVQPKDWQGMLGLGKRGLERYPKGITEQERLAIARRNDSLKRDWKNKLKALAQQLNPNIDVTLSKSDALLLLEYYRLKNSRTF